MTKFDRFTCSQLDITRQNSETPPILSSSSELAQTPSYPRRCTDQIANNNTLGHSRTPFKPSVGDWHNLRFAAGNLTNRRP